MTSNPFRTAITWISFSILLAGCESPPSRSHLELVRRSQPLLGTFVTISAYGSDKSELHQGISAAFEEIRRVDQLMSIHRKDSEISRLNRQASAAPVAVSSELFSVIAKAQEIALETAGAFDITIRPLADLWGFIWKEYRLPTEEELNQVLPLVNARWVELDPKRQTVQFLMEGISLDLGGIAKGYAVDRAIESLKANGITNAMVKAGGDLRVTGHRPGQRPWKVQLEDPLKHGHRTRIPLKEAALSTSGNYENYFVIDGHRYSHILDPRTGLPVEGIAACSVIAKTCTESDAWATALFVYGLDSSISRFGTRFPMRFTLVPKSGTDNRPTVRSNATLTPDNHF